MVSVWQLCLTSTSCGSHYASRASHCEKCILVRENVFGLLQKKKKRLDESSITYNTVENSTVQYHYFLIKMPNFGYLLYY